jgi:hypothetical protein
MDFKLVSDYKPQGDQGNAIKSLWSAGFLTASSTGCCWGDRVGEDLHHGQSDRGG